MCLICVEWEKGKLTLDEALRNYRELATTLDPGHADELADKLQVAIEEYLKDNP